MPAARRPARRSASAEGAWRRPTSARVLRIRDRLRETYGVPRMAPHGRPLEELILTVLSLEWMRDAPLQESRDYLVALPGVGRKTAACVLLFSYGLPDIPVDTHVSRVGTRLGLFRPGAGFEELHDEMLALTPAGGALELHVNLLRHGRRTCFARNPACVRCPLARMCPSRALFAG